MKMIIAEIGVTSSSYAVPHARGTAPVFKLSQVIPSQANYCANASPGGECRRRGFTLP
jgi:hypothetical protein